MSTFRARSLRFLKRFWWRRDGSTAIEFALVATPFFMLMLGIFETTSVYFASTTLEDAVDDASRRIRTGEVQSENMNAEQFRQLICNEVNVFLKCDSSLVVDVRSFADFSDVTFPPPLNPDGTMKNDQQFSPGGAGDVVLVRAYYTWKIATPIIGATLSNMANNSRLVASATTFRNEPFGGVGG